MLLEQVLPTDCHQIGSICSRGTQRVVGFFVIYCWSCLEFLPCVSYQFLSVLLQKVANFELIKYDVDQNEVVRNEKGYCVPVAPGMLIKFTFGNELDFAKVTLCYFL